MYIRNFLTLLRRYTTSSVLNIVGMAVAFAAVYLIAVQVKFDLSYNRVINNSERIYRLEYPSWYKDGHWGTTWNRQTPDLITAMCPEVEAAGSIYTWGGYQFTKDYSIKRNASIDNFKLQVSRAEPEGIDVFPFEWVAGDITQFKCGTANMLLTESAAKQFDLNVGDVIYMGRGAAHPTPLTIVAICKDFPEPSSIAYTDGWLAMDPQQLCDMSNWNDTYYVRLAEGTDSHVAEQKMREGIVDLLRKEGASEDDINSELNKISPRLTPIKDLYFCSDAGADGPHNGNVTTTYTLIAIGVLILVIAFINFVNFFFALIPSRIRAVNNYKIFGAPSWKLRLNFLFETIGLILISLFGAAIIVVLYADTLVASYISTSVHIANNLTIVVAMSVVILLFGLLVSLYPAWYITKFSPAFVIKGSFASSRSGRILRHTLVGVQYVISISLIICAIFIREQHQFMLNKDMGFDQSQLLSVDIPLAALAPTQTDHSSRQLDYTRRDAFSDRIKQHPMISDIAFGDGEIVAENRMGWGRSLDGKEVNVQIYPVSWNFLEMMGIEVTEGRNFTPTDELCENGVIIFNEEAKRQFDITLESKMMAHVSGTNATIAGFCENFNYKPAQFAVEPFAFIVYGIYGWALPTKGYVRTMPGADIAEVCQYIHNTIMEFAPNANPESCEVKLFDEEMQKHYIKEDKLSTLVTLFSFLSIVISIIGVFGLVLFETQYRRREIGIRRVHGASVGEILRLFNRKYLYIVSACSAVAIPVSYYIISRWMEQYVYRVEMSWWVYALAVGVILLITIVTVSLRSWRAANENPTESIMK